MPHITHTRGNWLLLFPGLTQLDATGPYEVLSRIPGAHLHLIARNRGPIACEQGLAIVPTTTFDLAPDLDVLLVPGPSLYGETRR